MAFIAQSSTTIYDEDDLREQNRSLLLENKALSQQLSIERTKARLESEKVQFLRERLEYFKDRYHHLAAKQKWLCNDNAEERVLPDPVALKIDVVVDLEHLEENNKMKRAIDEMKQMIEGISHRLRTTQSENERMSREIVDAYDERDCFQRHSVELQRSLKQRESQIQDLQLVYESTIEDDRAMPDRRPLVTPSFADTARPSHGHSMFSADYSCVHSVQSLQSPTHSACHSVFASYSETSWTERHSVQQSLSTFHFSESDFCSE